MTKNQIHEWREHGDDGVKRKFRGYWDSKKWRVAILEPDFDDWQTVEQPDLALWKSLRDVIWRKYQRKRLPYKFVAGLDEIIAELEPPADAGKSE
jgi:hypothetical protein